MTTIHMDVNEARRVRREIIRLQESIGRIMRGMNGYMSGVPQYWKASSADRFMELYGGYASEITGILGPLSEIASELQEAIEYWERVQERLSD